MPLRFQNSTLTRPGYAQRGLVLHFDPSVTTCYSGSGTTLNDLSGEGNSGSFSGSVTFSTPSLNDFGSNDYIATPDLGSHISGDAHNTTEIWFNNLMNQGVIASWCGQATPNSFYHFSHMEWQSNNSVRIGLWNGTGISDATAGTGLSDGTWYQFVGTYDGTTLRTYVNGVAGGTVNLNFDHPANTHIFLNHEDITDIAEGGTWSQGSYGVFRVYDRALTATEVLDNFNKTKGIYGL